MKPNHLLTFLCAALLTTELPLSGLHAQSQAAMNEEAARDFEAADARLNQTYKALLDQVDKPAQEKLKAAQRAWLQFRDAEAAFVADAEARGGSMEAMSSTTTSTALTKHRTEELRLLLKEMQEH